MGTLESFTIDPGGQLIGVFSNGLRRPSARSPWRRSPTRPAWRRSPARSTPATPAPGRRPIGAAGNGGRGTLASGALEMSNVDLAQEFTNLIVAQRGFQANSKVITASDELLQDLVNLKR